MKPKITWIVCADNRSTRVFSNAGPGKGVVEVPDQALSAKPATEYADAPGQGHSSHGPASAAKMRRDPKDLAAKAFAKEVADALTSALRKGAYDRLVLVAAPPMLGEVRPRLDEPVRAVLYAEVPKDLIGIDAARIPDHLADVLAV